MANHPIEAEKLYHSSGNPGGIHGASRVNDKNHRLPQEQRPARRYEEKMADINPLSFGQTTELLGNAIKGAGLENAQISNNLANVNTPNYRRSTTNFKDALQASLGNPASTDEMTLATDNDRQFALDGAEMPTPFDPQATVDSTIQMRVDGSNVDVDQEMARLSENTGYSQTMSQLLQEQYKFLREAITEQTN